MLKLHLFTNNKRNWFAFLIISLLLLGGFHNALAQTGNPVLTIASQIPATPNGSVTVSLDLNVNGHNLNSGTISIDKPDQLAFDNTDINGDGIPDSITLDLPPQYIASVTYDANDTDGEIDIAVFTLSANTLIDGSLAAITFTAGDPGVTTEIPVTFSTDPAATFGSTSGQGVTADTNDGSVLITVVGPPTPVPTPMPSDGQITGTISIGSTGTRGYTAYNIIFPFIDIQGEDTIAYAQDETWSVFDSTNTGAGYDLTLSANDFSDGNGHTIPVDGFKVHILDSEIVPVNTDNPAPVSLVTSPTSLSPTNITILSAARNTGMGTFEFPPHFELFVPGDTIVGTYTTTVYITMSVGP